MNILFLPGSYSGPAGRFRLWQFVEPLRKLGHKVEVRVTRPSRTWESAVSSKTLRRLHGTLGSGLRIASALWMLRDAARFDVIMMNRDIVPNTRIDFIELWLAKRNAGLIFDFDDAIHLGAREHKLRKILPYFAWVTPGNEFLAEFARQNNPNVSVWPTVVDTDVYQPGNKRVSGMIRIGWSGSTSTMQYCLPLLQETITELAQSETFEFIVISNSPPLLDWPNVSMRYIPWNPETEVQGLQQIDIGLMPLQDNPFERGKCGLKAIQYMAVGIPALVSPVGVNCSIVTPGVNGFHCSTKEDWLRTLRTLIHNQSLRCELGKCARATVEARYSVQALMPQMLEVFEKVRKASWRQK